MFIESLSVVFPAAPFPHERVTTENAALSVRKFFETELIPSGF
jgi:hypothetical protein